MRILVYTKTKCPWAQDVLAFLTLHRLPFVEKDMYVKEEYKRECLNKTGQWKSPTVDIDGHLIPDTDPKQVGEYLKSKGLIK